MRKPAAELDVNPMSPYHHVENRTALLRGVCSVVAAGLRLPPDDGTPWQDQLRALGHAYRSVACAHPDLWSYLNTHPALIDEEGELWTVFNRILVAAGVPPERLPATRTALYTFVAGFLSAETGGSLAEFRGASDADGTFEVALDLIVAGLASGHS